MATNEQGVTFTQYEIVKDVKGFKIVYDDNEYGRHLRHKDATEMVYVLQRVGAAYELLMEVYDAYEHTGDDRLHAAMAVQEAVWALREVAQNEDSPENAHLIRALLESANAEAGA